MKSCSALMAAATLAVVSAQDTTDLMVVSYQLSAASVAMYESALHRSELGSQVLLDRRHRYEHT